MLLGISGRAQHGKDTSADFLTSYFGFRRAAFADPLRELVRLVNPLVEVPARSTGDDDYIARYSDVLERFGYEEAKKIPEVRRLLQQVGTRCREVLGDDVWTDAFLGHMMKNHDLSTENIVVTDARFPNEAQTIRDLGGSILKVIRPGFLAEGIDPNHPSEANVDLIEAEYNIIATNMDELGQGLVALTEELKLTPVIATGPIIDPSVPAGFLSGVLD